MYRQRVGDYYIGKTIGEGSFAKVKYGQHAETEETVAIKVLDKEMVEKAKLAHQIKKEIAIMRRLRHPHVVDLKQVMATGTHIYLVLELVTGGELFERVAGEGPLREATARKYFQQLLDGLAHCHSQGVFHRDLKLENILLTADGEIKLSDFGLGTFREAAQMEQMLQTVCGTPNYAAPEVLQRQLYAGAPADIWSLGVCLYVMLAGSLPFDERSVGSLLRKICAADYETPPWITTHAATLLRAMLTPDPEKRATIEELRRHPWVAVDYHPTTVPEPLLSATEESNELTFSGNENTVREALSPVRRVMSPTRAGKKQLNAFELLGSAMDISSLFEKGHGHRHQTADTPHIVRRATRFTSRSQPAAILDLVEQSAAQLGARCERQDFEGSPSLRLTVSAGRGQLTVTVNVGSLVPGLQLVEFHRARGDSIDFFQFYHNLMPMVSKIVARRDSTDGRPLSPSDMDAISRQMVGSSLAAGKPAPDGSGALSGDENGMPNQSLPADGAASPALSGKLSLPLDSFGVEVEGDPIFPNPLLPEAGGGGSSVDGSNGSRKLPPLKTRLAFEGDAPRAGSAAATRAATSGGSAAAPQESAATGSRDSDAQSSTAAAAAAPSGALQPAADQQVLIGNSATPSATGSSAQPAANAAAAEATHVDSRGSADGVSIASTPFADKGPPLEPPPPPSADAMQWQSSRDVLARVSGRLSVDSLDL